MELICPCCREPNATIDMRIVGDEQFTCQDCGDDFTFADVEKFIESVSNWKIVLEWASRCPARQPELVLKD